MLGDCRDKFKGCKHLEIPFIAAIAHLRAVDNRSGFLDITQLRQRKGIADDVLGDILDAFGVTRLKPQQKKNDTLPTISSIIDGKHQ